jgi:hypothetical protein
VSFTHVPRDNLQHMRLKSGWQFTLVGHRQTATRSEERRQGSAPSPWQGQSRVRRDVATLPPAEALSVLPFKRTELLLTASFRLARRVALT